jgi:filamentous hemagglutinin
VGKREHEAPGGAGGRWPVIDERPDPSVVRQTSDMSCVSACGEMLLKDRGVNTLSQADLLVHLDAPAITLRLADVLNRLSPSGRWRGDYLDVSAMGEGKAIEILSNSGSWVAGMREVGAKIDHAVVVDGVNDGDTVSVRDPFDATSYTMRIEDFLGYWTWAAIWQEEA